MNKKVKTIIEIVLIIILILIFIKILKNNSSENSDTNESLSNIQYDEENNEYYIKDEETGEILHSASSEDELYIYTIDPDYDPQNPDEASEYDYYVDTETDSNDTSTEELE